MKSGKIWKPGGKWKNFVKVWKVEKFVKMCETLENLSKNEKILKWQKRENWKILEKTCLKVTKSEKLWSKVERCEKSGVKWENLVKVWKVETFGNIFKNIETAKKVKIENCGKTWFKGEKSEKPGGQ